MKRLEPLIFEVSSPGRKAYSLPPLEVPDKPVESMLPKNELRTVEPELRKSPRSTSIRHFTRLSQLNHGVDIGFYPLGSCTMKYSPRSTIEVSNLPGLAEIHPYAPRRPCRAHCSSCMRCSSTCARSAGWTSSPFSPPQARTVSLPASTSSGPTTGPARTTSGPRY